MKIKLITPHNFSHFSEHFKRHQNESGRGENLHFMPFDPDDPDGPTGIDKKSLGLSLDEPGWQRCWGAFYKEKIIGHVDLKNDRLKTGLHRCTLGIGIEAPYRKKGLGKRLMNSAIEFARHSNTLSWIDLRVFSYNQGAIALYKRCGFKTIGTLKDRFRIKKSPSMISLW